jgi:hypothetical protein
MILPIKPETTPKEEFCTKGEISKYYMNIGS